MSDQIQCCDPHGKHFSKPYVATKKTLSTFRPITEQMRYKSDVLLPLAGHICNSCRLALSNKPSSSTELRDANLTVPQSPMPKPSGTFASKCITCCNPLGIHVKPKRKGSSGQWFRMQGKLLQRAEELPNILDVTLNGHVCFECKYRIYMDHAKLFSPGIYCADPLRRHSKPTKKQFLSAFKSVTESQVQIANQLGLNLYAEDYLCWGCSKALDSKLSEITPVQDEQEPMDQDDSSLNYFRSEEEQFSTSDSDTDESDVISSNDHSDNEYFNEEVAEARFTDVCNRLGIKYERKKDLRTQSKCLEIESQIQNKVRYLMQSFLPSDTQFLNKKGKGCWDCNQLVEQLAIKHRNADTLSEKYRCMTTAPKWVSISNIQEKFEVCRSTAIKVSKLRKQSGPLSAPAPRVGKRLPAATVSLVTSFYQDDKNSRFCPAARDTIFVRTKGGVGQLNTKTLVQKREILCTMRQLYNEFKDQYPYVDISISKFASLRPKECVWGFRKGFQKSCLCCIHTNFKLLCEAVKIKGRTTEILNNFFCSQNEKCLMGVCEDCPVYTVIDNIVETWESPNIEYWRWGSNANGPTIELEKKSSTSIEFQGHFKESLGKIAEHHFTYTNQQSYINSLKTFVNISDETGVVNVDFGQNYSFVVPNSVQSFHWNNSQATIHPFCLYFKSPGTDQVKLFSYIVISDSLVHDALIFHVFRTSFIKYLKSNYPWIKELVFISDGAGSQYKNAKNFTNLFLHLKEYGIKARWCFSATAHGKDVVDAMSAVTKRLVRLESLRRSDNFILNAEDMTEFLQGQNRDDSKRYVYISSTMIENHVKEMNSQGRFDQIKAVPGTRKFHYVDVIENQGLLFKTFALSSESYLHTFKNNADLGSNGESMQISIQSGDYAYFVRSGIAYVGIATNINEELGEIELQLMKKSGRFYVWKSPSDFKNFSSLDLVAKLSVPTPMTSSCRSYQFICNEILEAQEKGKRITMIRNQNK